MCAYVFPIQARQIEIFPFQNYDTESESESVISVSSMGQSSLKMT